MSTAPLLPTSGQEVRSPQVVVVGSGFAGYFAARRLGRLLRPTGVAVTLLSDTDGMLYSPLLPEVAVGALDPRAIVVPIFDKLPGVTAVRGRAQQVDVTARLVHYTDPDGADRTLPYDRILLAPGSVTRLFDIPGLAEHAVGLRSIAEALYLRDHLLTRLEIANAMPDPAARRAALTFLIVGGGYAGTELCAQLARFAHRLLPRYPHVDPADLHFLLADVAHAVMPELGAKLGAEALAVLRRRHVDVRLGVSIKRIDGDQVTLTDDHVLEHATVVWCAGVIPNPLMAKLGLPTEKGKLAVSPNLQVIGHDDMYAIGDAAAVRDLTKAKAANGERPLCPPTAQHAMRQATTAARNIAASLGHGTAKVYRHHDLGLVVDLGGRDAVATPLGVHLEGPLAKLISRAYRLYALPSVERRVRVAADWILGARSSMNTVTFGLVSKTDALVTHAENHQPA